MKGIAEVGYCSDPTFELVRCWEGASSGLSRFPSSSRDVEMTTQRNSGSPESDPLLSSSSLRSLLDIETR